MKTYYVSAQVTIANGQQTFKVQAENEKEAIQKAEHGDESEIQPEMCDVEVEGLDWENAEVVDEGPAEPPDDGIWRGTCPKCVDQIRIEYGAFEHGRCFACQGERATTPVMFTPSAYRSMCVDCLVCPQCRGPLDCDPPPPVKVRPLSPPSDDSLRCPCGGFRDLSMCHHLFRADGLAILVDSARHEFGCQKCGASGFLRPGDKGIGLPGAAGTVPPGYRLETPEEAKEQVRLCWAYLGACSQDDAGATE